MEIGKLPSMIVVRSFRGHTLYLVSVTRAPKGFRWNNNRKQAQRYVLDDARALAREASRDYGALCVVMGLAGEIVSATQLV